MFTPQEIEKLKQKLASPEGADAINTIIASIESMATSVTDMKNQTEALGITCDNFKKIAEDNEKACIDLTQTIKHIHIALNTYREELPPELVNLANELGKFVMSGAAIKVGVKDNANNSK